ncbi:transglycosylase domain-containing protein [Bacteroidales bacterium OttesenSCG-928-L03]|nr:transglycosylase domain-containing protein [Bacteroidales bacterium OttesenSCG-928-L03]
MSRLPMKEKAKKILKKSLVWLRSILLTLFVLSLFLVVLYKYVPVYQPLNFVVRSAENLFAKSKISLQHHWIALDEISPDLVKAAMASEDNLFLIHNGFDFGGQEINPNLPIRNRYPTNSGTITQQTARAVFLFPRETYLNELLETYFSLLIEFVWGKERIMEVYLNSIELANGRYGVDALKGDFPDKEIDSDLNWTAQLTREDCAMIAVLIQNPREMDINRPTAYMLKNQAKILALMDKLIPIEF